MSSWLLKYAPFILIFDIFMSLFFLDCTITTAHLGKEAATVFGAFVTVVGIANVAMDIVILKQRAKNA